MGGVHTTATDDPAGGSKPFKSDISAEPIDPIVAWLSKFLADRGAAKSASGIAGTPLPGVRTLQNLSYGGDGRMLNLYWSKQADRPMPVIVYYNSGTMFRRGRGAADSLCQLMAARGFAVVNADIRPLSDSDAKGAIEDAAAVLSWIYDTKGEYGLDGGNVFAVGSSYGALEALWTTLLADTARLPEALGGGIPDVEVRSCGLLSPRTDMGEPGPMMRTVRRSLQSVGRKYPRLAEAIRLETNHELNLLPDVFVQSGDADRSKRAADKLHGMLATNGVRCEYMFFDAADGLTEAFVERRPELTQSVRVVSAMTRYFRDRLGGEDERITSS